MSSEYLLIAPPPNHTLHGTALTRPPDTVGFSRVRVFDLRCGSSVMSLYAHQLGVSSIQADDWKIVSGGEEGLVCVWEMRMRTKLWEMHNRLGQPAKLLVINWLIN